MGWRGERRRASDNVDLSGAEHAWWAGSGPGRRSLGPPPGMAERRASGPAEPPPPPDQDTIGVAAWVGVATAQATLDAPVRVDDPWQRSTSDGVAEAYRALGIDWEATWPEVMAEFRMQAACWHPDRLAAADAAVQAEGQRRMSELNRAYDELRRALRPTHRRELFAD